MLLQELSAEKCLNRWFFWVFVGDGSEGFVAAEQEEAALVSCRLDPKSQRGDVSIHSSCGSQVRGA